MQSAQKLFKGNKIKFTDKGERHLGSVIETESFREQYIKNKVEAWVKDLQLLSNYAQHDPQAAYSAFTKELCSRWTYFQRIILDMSRILEPLENTIKHQLIHALLDDR